MKTKKIQIKDLKKGMKIKSLRNGEIVFREVQDVFTTEVPKQRQRKLIFSNGAELICSDTHPIMSADAREVYPDDIKETDKFLTDDGEIVTLVSRENIDVDPNFIDITVDDTETFFAGASADKLVLTHNCSQGGLRGASATVSYPWWHYELEELLVLKNNKGTEETRERHLDYSVQFNDFFLKLVERDEDVWVFCPKSAKDLQDAFYRGDDVAFEREYYKGIKDSSIRKKNIGAARSVVLSTYLNERHGTGRLYAQNMSSMVNNGPFAPLVQDSKYWLTSNLCVTGDTQITVRVEGEEFTLPIDALQTAFDKDSTLMEIKSFDEETQQARWSVLQDFGMTGLDKEVLTITDEATGFSVSCTPEHKLLTKNRGWVMAKDLVDTDELEVLC